MADEPHVSFVQDRIRSKEPDFDRVFRRDQPRRPAVDALLMCSGSVDFQRRQTKRPILLVSPSVTVWTGVGEARRSDSSSAIAR